MIVAWAGGVARAVTVVAPADGAAAAGVRAAEVSAGDTTALAGAGAGAGGANFWPR